MPTDSNERLYLLLQQERQRAATARVAARRETAHLPDLNPETLMSAAAVREMRAAQGPVFVPRTAPVPQARIATAAPVQEPSEWGMDLSDEEALPTTASSNVSLEDILMASARKETGDYDYVPVRGRTEVVSYLDDFQFDTPPIEGAGPPNPAARFQIGRQSPPRMAFRSGDIASGGSDGSIVSRRGNDGSWQTSGSRPTTTASEPRSGQFTLPRSASRAEAVPSPAAPRPQALSALERLITGKSGID